MCEILEAKGCPVQSCVLIFIWLTPRRHRLHLCQMRRCARSHAALLIPGPRSSLVRMPSIFSSAGAERHPEKQNLAAFPRRKSPAGLGSSDTQSYGCACTQRLSFKAIYHNSTILLSKKAQCPWTSWPHCEDPVSSSCLEACPVVMLSIPPLYKGRMNVDIEIRQVQI